MACDCCGKIGVQLEPLLDSYKTPDVQDICADCRDIINRHLTKVRTTTGNIQRDLMRRFIRQRKVEVTKPTQEADK